MPNGEPVKTSEPPKEVKPGLTSEELQNRVNVVKKAVEDVDTEIKQLSEQLKIGPLDFQDMNNFTKSVDTNVIPAAKKVNTAFKILKGAIDGLKKLESNAGDLKGEVSKHIKDFQDLLKEKDTRLKDKIEKRYGEWKSQFGEDAVPAFNYLFDKLEDYLKEPDLTKASLRNIERTAMSEMSAQIKQLDQSFTDVITEVTGEAFKKKDYDVNIIKEKLSAGIKGIKGAPRIDVHVVDLVQRLNNSADSERNRLLKSKNAADAPTYKKLIHYSRNTAGVFMVLIQLLNREKIKVDKINDFLKFWDMKSKDYARFKELGPKKFNRLYTKIHNLEDALGLYHKFILDNLKLMDLILQFEDSIWKKIIDEFKPIEDPSKVNELKKLVDEMKIGNVEESGKMSEESESPEGERLDVKLDKDLSGIVELFQSYIEYNKKLKNSINYITGLIANSKNWSDNQQVLNRIDLIKSIRKLLEAFDTLSNDTKVMQNKFKLLNDGYKNRYDDLVLKFGSKSDESQQIMNSYNNIVKMLSEITDIPTKISDRKSKIEALFRGAQDLEKKWVGKKLADYLKVRVGSKFGNFKYEADQFLSKQEVELEGEA